MYVEAQSCKRPISSNNARNRDSCLPAPAPRPFNDRVGNRSSTAILNCNNLFVLYMSLGLSVLDTLMEHNLVSYKDELSYHGCTLGYLEERQRQSCAMS